MYRLIILLFFSLTFGMSSCSQDDDALITSLPPDEVVDNKNNSGLDDGETDYNTPESENMRSDKYTDPNGNVAYIPTDFKVSTIPTEQVISTGLVVIGPDGSEYVWIPTDKTELAVRDFGSYFYGNSLSGYADETSLPLYQEMMESVKKFGGFYIGRYEASYGGGDSLENYYPASKPVTPDSQGQIWVRFSPQDATVACQNLYADNSSVKGFFLWGINWDTTLQWLIDSGSLTLEDVADDSTSWGNYSNDSFSPNANGNYTGLYEEAKKNNIYDLAGNNWEWTQERYGGSSYVMRGGGYNLMGGSCPGDMYPAAIRDPLPGNSHHPNVCFRVGLFLTKAKETSGIKPVYI